MTDVFISYAHGDSSFADTLSRRLKSSGLTVWLDSSVLIGGEEYRAQIQRQVASARVVLLLLSKHSQRSTSVHEELIHALEAGEPQRVIPVLLDGEAEANVVWPLVADRQAVRGGSQGELIEAAVAAVNSTVCAPAELASRARKRLWIVTSVVAVLALVGSLVAFQFGLHQEAQRVRYTIQVFDAATSTGIASASVRLSPDSRIPGGGIGGLTDSLGRLTLTLDSSLRGKPVEVTVEREGFKPSAVTSVVASDVTTATVRLEPIAPPVSLPIPTDPSRVKETLLFRSGPKLSGVKKEFSGWYELCSGPLPRDSIIESDEFTLSGDRACGAWAECREERDKRTSSQVCWQFRLQGHDEWPGSGQAASEGILRITISRPKD